MVLNCWLARESISPHLPSSPPPPPKLPLLLLHQPSSDFHPQSFGLFPPLDLPYPTSPAIFVLFSFKQCQNITRKTNLTTPRHKSLAQSRFFPMILPFPHLLFSCLPPLFMFLYRETGVEGLSSWNFYEYWSATGSSGLWEEEQGWRRSDGRMDGWMKVAEGVVKRDGEGDWAGERGEGR